MKILALDSSGIVASVALIEEDCLIGEYTIHHKKTHSQTLLPMLDAVVQMTELDLDSLDAIAVASGPGSFTGLRIGSATAKGLAQALEKPIIEVPTTEAIAYNLFGVTALICPLMDARRNQVYTGLYQWKNAQFQVIENQMAVAIEDIIDKMNHYNLPVILLGDGAVAFHDQLCEQLKTPYDFAPPHLLRQRAAAVGARALEYFKEGKTVSAKQHKPDYLRLSQAERERLEKNEKENS